MTKLDSGDKFHVKRWILFIFSNTCSIRATFFYKFDQLLSHLSIFKNTKNAEMQLHCTFMYLQKY